MVKKIKAKQYAIEAKAIFTVEAPSLKNAGLMVEEMLNVLPTIEIAIVRGQAIVPQLSEDEIANNE